MVCQLVYWSSGFKKAGQCPCTKYLDKTLDFNSPSRDLVAQVDTGNCQENLTSC